jgi:hypothetical protein
MDKQLTRYLAEYADVAVHSKQHVFYAAVFSLVEVADADELRFAKGRQAMSSPRRVVADGSAKLKHGRLDVGKRVWFLALPCQAPWLVIPFRLVVDAGAGAALWLKVHKLSVLWREAAKHCGANFMPREGDEEAEERS